MSSTETMLDAEYNGFQSYLNFPRNHISTTMQKACVINAFSWVQRSLRTIL